MKTSKREKLAFIIRIVKETGGTKLSSRCGRFHALTEGGKGVCALGFGPRGGTTVSDLSRLSGKTISQIYCDLKVDFD